MAEFFAMGGYAAYVWPSYGITALVLVLVLVVSLRQARESERTLAILRETDPGRRRPGGTNSEGTNGEA